MNEYKIGDRVWIRSENRAGVVADVFVGPLSGTTIYVVGDFGYRADELMPAPFLRVVA